MSLWRSPLFIKELCNQPLCRQVGLTHTHTHTLMISVSMATESAASLLRCRSDRGVCNSSSVIFIPSVCLSALTSTVLVVYKLCEGNTTFLYQTLILKRLGGRTGAQLLPEISIQLVVKLDDSCSRLASLESEAPRHINQPVFSNNT